MTPMHPHVPAHPTPHAQAYVPEDQLQAARRVLYGSNAGGAVQALDLPGACSAAASEGGFDLQAYRFTAAPEELRPPRIVRIGLVQNRIVLPTTSPFAEQRKVR